MEAGLGAQSTWEPGGGSPLGQDDITSARQRLCFPQIWWLSHGGGLATQALREALFLAEEASGLTLVLLEPRQGLVASWCPDLCQGPQRKGSRDSRQMPAGEAAAETVSDRRVHTPSKRTHVERLPATVVQKDGLWASFLGLGSPVRGLLTACEGHRTVAREPWG